MSPLLTRARSRLALAAGLAALTLALGVSPAAAQAAPPPAEATGSRFDLGVATLLRALDQADQADEPAARGELASTTAEPTSPWGDRGCVDAGPADADIPTMVAEIFLCRLAEAGVPHDQARQVAAEAIAVAHCESRFDPDVVVFDGRYVDTPHPATGYRYSAAGVFQFIRKTADTWIEPDGYARVFAPRRNIDAAARLYIHNRILGLRGWEDWACAAVNDGFKQGGSVLPGWPGGPAALPDWVWNHVR